MGLSEYKRKRHFAETPEPQGNGHGARNSQRFVVQKHAASRLHYDFRLELDGVLKSWAVPKGPSLDPTVKALAVHVEDHPVEYGSFEGTIPENQYGAGTVMLWDRGTWEPEGDPKTGYRKGKLKFKLHGEKLNGRWTLIRMSGKAGDDGKNWLLKKLDDTQARTAGKRDLLEEKPESVASGRTMDEIAADADQTWSQGAAVKKKPAKKRASPKKRSQSTNGALISPSSLTGAVRRRQPSRFQPQLATLVRQIPETDDWLHELKFDGYRLMCFFRGGRPHLVTRRGLDWTHRFPTVAQAALGLKVKNAIVDGEVVVLSRNGTTSFQALQNLLQRKRDDDIVWYVFDLPHCEGFDLTQTPLVERKALLKQLLQTAPNDVIRYSDHLVGNGAAAFSKACRRGLEGLICKRVDSPYQQRRTDDWVKVKCLSRQEFLIAGWTEPSGSRAGFGALLLGYYDKHRRLVYAGRVGTGFSNSSLRQLKALLHKLEQDQPPFEEPPSGSEAHGVHWVRPQLVAEVEFTQWTNDGRLRHPSFQGLREDKKPEEVVREVPLDQPSEDQDPPNADKSRRRKTQQSKHDTALADSRHPAGVRLTHPDRVLYPEQGLTKQDLANYYVHVADWILPHLIHRPLMVVRCPSGQAGKCFYQKHLAEGLSAPVRGIKVKEESGIKNYMGVDDLPGLVTLVQMSALELHPWGSREDKLDYPDRMILDLDPGPGVAWHEVVSAAGEVHAVLDALGLKSFVRTSGGKGLHVVVPLVRRATWDVVKDLAKAIAEFLARHAPAKFVATSSKVGRKGKIYADYLRNDRGATAIASYSTRALSGAPVATPLRWDELTPQIKPEKFTVRTVPERLASVDADPWEGFFDVRQAATIAMVRKIKQ